MINAVKEYIQTCPFLKDYRVNVDFHGEGMSYSIDPLPCDPVLRRYMDGGMKKQFQFALSSQEVYDEDARVNIANSMFYMMFEDWIEECNYKRELPELPGKKSATGIEVMNSGFIYDANKVMAKYQIECRLLYEQEV